LLSIMFPRKLYSLTSARVDISLTFLMM
jgi:hypothetical protein